MATTSRRRLAVSVDLDPIRCYYAIHGLGGPTEDLADVILRRALPRFLETFARHGITATLFVVGADLDAASSASAASSRALLREAQAAGHELANHTFSHPYDLARSTKERIRNELLRAHALIGEVAGAVPRGFRAPGYDVSARLFGELERLGYRYDSSIFPAPGYWLAKATVMTALRLVGKTSGAVVTDPRTLAASPEPYRPSSSAPWRRGSSSLCELPIAVTPFARVPVIGTNLLLAPDALRVHWLNAMRRRAFFNLELHGIDLIDTELDGIPAELALRQPDLRASLDKKRHALEATLGRLCLEYEVVPLVGVAEAFAAEEAG